MRSPIGRILAVQILATCLITLLLLPLGEITAFSAMLGGLICFVPNLYLAYRLTAKRTAEPNKSVQVLYTAELGKIVITATLFATVFATQEWIQPVFLLGGFGVVQLAHWITPVVMGTETNKCREK